MKKLKFFVDFDENEDIHVSAPNGEQMGLLPPGTPGYERALAVLDENKKVEFNEDVINANFVVGQVKIRGNDGEYQIQPVPFLAVDFQKLEQTRNIMRDRLERREPMRVPIIAYYGEKYLPSMKKAEMKRSFPCIKREETEERNLGWYDDRGADTMVLSSSARVLRSARAESKGR
jgi:hypothetical protein